MLVSLIIPVYKVEDYIIDCLSSVYAQTYDKIEVIIVDDCSPDNSLAIASELIKDLESRYIVRTVKHVENKGLSAARNSGVQVATGEYLYFLDSDDELSANCIECLMKSITGKGTEVDFAVGGCKVEGAEVQFFIQSPPYTESQPEIISDFLQYKWPMTAWNKLISRQLFINNDLWFEEGLLHEDELFSFKLACVSNRMAAVYEETYIYKIRTVGSITANMGTRNFDSLLRINSYKYKVISSVLQSRPDIKGCMSYVISTTLIFVNSIRLNRSLMSAQKRKYTRDQFALFARTISFKKKLRGSDYLRVLLVMRAMLRVVL